MMGLSRERSVRVKEVLDGSNLEGKARKRYEDFLISQNQLTEIALANLGATEGKPPGETVGMDVLVDRSEGGGGFVYRTNTLEVVAMPGIGTGKMVDRFVLEEYGQGPLLIDNEMVRYSMAGNYGEIGPGQIECIQKNLPGVGEVIISREKGKEFKNEGEHLDQEVAEQTNRFHRVTLENGVAIGVDGMLTDMINCRASFLCGEPLAGPEAVKENPAWFGLHRRSGLMTMAEGTVVLIISEEELAERNKDDPLLFGDDRLRWQRAIFEQTLRLHRELMMGKWFTTLYEGVSLSGLSEEESYQKFRGVVRVMFEKMGTKPKSKTLRMINLDDLLGGKEDLI